MIVHCTQCGTQFDQPGKAGRPIATCSEECRAQARKTTERFCRKCGKPYDLRTTPTPPYFCGHECQLQPRDRCMQCRQTIPATAHGTRVRSAFCSAVCMHDHTGDVLCKWCDKLIDVPQSPPWRRMPRFCDDSCRTNWFHRNNPTHMSADQEMFNKSVEPMPMHRGYPLDAVATDASKLTPDQRWCVDFYTWTLAKAQPHLDADQYVMFCMLTGTAHLFSRQDDPLPLLPLASCWPYIPRELRPSLSQYRALLKRYYMHATSPDRAAKLSQETFKLYRTVELNREKLSKAENDFWYARERRNPTQLTLRCQTVHAVLHNHPAPSAWLSPQECEFYEPALRLRELALTRYIEGVNIYLADGTVPKWTQAIPATTATNPVLAWVDKWRNK